MRVLVISGMYARPEGVSYAGQAIHRQVVESMRTGVQPTVLCPGPRITRRRAPSWSPSPIRIKRAVTVRSELDGVPVTYFPFWNAPLGLLPALQVRSLYRSLVSAVRRLGADSVCDVIHAHQLFPTGYSAWMLAQRLKVPIILSAVGSDVHSYPHRSRYIHEKTVQAIRGSEQVITVSRALARDVEALARPKRPVLTIHRGVDAHHFAPAESQAASRSKLGLPVTGLGVCSVGRLVSEKGVSELLAAFHGLSSRFPQAWLAIVGSGPLRSAVEEETKARSLVGRVHLPGDRPHTEIGSWVNAADVFALASYAEGLPNVVLEAMACSRPVVATNVGGTAEALEDGVSGYLVPPMSEGGLRNALEMLLSSEQLRNDFGAAGRRKVLEQFSWRRNAEALRAVYQEVQASTTDGRNRVTLDPHAH